MSELEARPVAAAPAPSEPGLVRAWALLAGLLLLTAPLGGLYNEGFHYRATGQSLTGSMSGLMGLYVAQEFLLGLPLAFFGLRMARTLGWGAPFLAGERPWREAAFGLSLAILVGMACDLSSTGIILAVVRLFPHALTHGPLEYRGPAPWKGAVGALHAGVGEEVVMRLFALSLFAWVLMKLFRRTGAPPAAIFWVANLIAALGFGALHFSNMRILQDPFTFPNVAMVLGLNGLLGLTCGWLYRRYGLEAAMAAHFAAGFMGHGVFPELLRLHRIAVLS